jgi:hypothetical protein
LAKNRDCGIIERIINNTPRKANDGSNERSTDQSALLFKLGRYVDHKEETEWLDYMNIKEKRFSSSSKSPYPMAAW